jgi:hypothetical protein
MDEGWVGWGSQLGRCGSKLQQAGGPEDGWEDRQALCCGGGGGPEDGWENRQALWCAK